MKKKQKNIGSALITLLAFMSAAAIFVTLAVSVIVSNEQATFKYEQGEETLTVAEGGAENGIMQLMRNPSYAGETLQIGNGTATITATGSGTRTITSDGVLNNFHRRIQVVGNYNNAVFSIT